MLNITAKNGGTRKNKMKLYELTQRTKIHEAIADCMQRKIQLTENVFRAGSDAYYETFRVARDMLAKGQLQVDDNMREMLEMTDIGEYHTMKDGRKLPLDCPMVEDFDSSHPDFAKAQAHKTEEEDVKDILDKHNIKDLDDIELGTPAYEELFAYYMDSGEMPYGVMKARTGMPDEWIIGRLEDLGVDDMIGEAEYKGKDVDLNKPKRGGPKKYYVYVKNPKTGNVKKINFGDAGGLTAKINDPDAVRSFVARHDCKNKNDKTKAGYWACRLPRYGKSLGLKGGGAWW